MKTFIITLALAAMGTTVSAQSKPATAVASGSHECIMATDANALTSLGLSPEQITQVNAIQADCKKACAMASKDASMQHASDKHAEQLKGVLTPEQYTNWVAWCAKNPAKTELTPAK